jgi:hypothetical protein
LPRFHLFLLGPSLFPAMMVLDMTLSLAADVMSRHRISHVIWPAVSAALLAM